MTPQEYCGIRLERRRDMSEEILHVTDANFEMEILNSKIPALVDFWATWCAPCRAIAPIVEEMAETYSGKVKFAKMNVDENPAIPGKYGVRGIPTLILFKDGQVVDQVVGAVPKSQIQGLIDKITA
jgi:thioredoxin 1